MIEPYKITSATLVTYSGRTFTVEMSTDTLTCPYFKAKERLLDSFQDAMRQSNDPPVSVKKMVVETLFKKEITINLCC